MEIGNLITKEGERRFETVFRQWDDEQQPIINLYVKQEDGFQIFFNVIREKNENEEYEEAIDVKLDHVKKIINY